MRVRTSKTCATPTCRRPLAGRWPHPLCPECRTAAPRPQRAGTRRVIVSVPTTAQPHYAAVTLPAEPWEAGA